MDGNLIVGLSLIHKVRCGPGVVDLLAAEWAHVAEDTATMSTSTRAASLMHSQRPMMMMMMMMMVVMVMVVMVMVVMMMTMTMMLMMMID
eukprot:892983-Amphidinium_carterae.1